MAIKKCKECGEKVSSKAEKCPHCGAPQKMNDKYGGCSGCLGAIIIAIIIAAIAGVFGGGGGSGSNGSSHKTTWRDKDNSTMAYIMMEEYVKRRLKSPSTASFQGVFHGRSNTIKKLSNNTYSINSYVDSQNGFGATLRTRFRGKIKQVSKNQWKLVSLEFP